MITLPRIAQDNPIKQLRSTFNAAMDEIQGDQPLVGMGRLADADYWGPGDNASGFRHVAHSPLGMVQGTLLVQCLPDNTDAVITDANGEIWPAVRPTLDATITKLKYTWVTLNVTSVRLPARVLTVFKTLVDYGFDRQNYVFAPHLQQITREPVFPLGLKALFKPNSGADLQWAATYLSGTRDKFMLILHTGLLGDSD